MKSKTKISKKAHKFKLTTNKVYGLAIVVLFLVVFAQGYYINYLWQKDKSNSAFITRQLIKTALDDLYTLGKDQVQINYDKQVVTLPAARVTLPYQVDIHSGLSAIHTVGFENSADSITFTDNDLMNSGVSSLSFESMEALFKGVPKAQACFRQVLVEFNDTETSEFNGDYEKAFSKTLKDGRKVTGFKSTVCTQGADEFAAYIEKMQSY